MKISVRILIFMVLLICTGLAGIGGMSQAGEPTRNPVQSDNLLKPERWADKFRTGDWTWEGQLIVCDSKNNKAGRNCFQNDVKLNQDAPLPIVITVWNKAENVVGGYSLFVDFVCKGEPNASHGVSVPFPTGTHDWVRRRMIIIPGAPVTQANPHLWFEKQPSGKVWYKDIDVHQVDSREALADLEGITEESLRNYEKNTVKDVVCVAMVGGEGEIIADVMAKNFTVPREKVLALFKVPPSKNLYYSEADIIAGCWAAEFKKGDLETLYNKKKTMSFNDFAKKELELDDVMVAAFAEKSKTILDEIKAAKIKTILSGIEKVKQKYNPETMPASAPMVDAKG